MQILFYFLLFLAPYTTQTKKECKNKNAHMTIFLHGTLKPVEFSFSSMLKIMKDKIDNTLYSVAATFLRKDKKLYCSQAIQERGLQPIKMIPSKKYSTAEIIAHLYNMQLEYLNKKPENQLYYTFGWNGLLSDSKRYQEAEFFYSELVKELEFLAQHDLYPTIEIIAYSHGGNVALYLPAVNQIHPSLRHKPIEIERLVLLGTPILKETKHLVTDPSFKSIYNFYSTEDNIQTMDFFSSQSFFPQRLFTSNKKVKIPPHVFNVRMRITKDIKFRYTFETKKHEHHEILKSSRTRLIHKDPGHCELWNFSWGSYWYREDIFPLSPLPVMALLPTFLHTVEQYPEYQNITVDFAPKDNAIMLFNKKYKFKKTYTFLDKKTQDSLWSFAKKHAPEDCSLDKQKERVNKALLKAKEELKKENNYKNPHSKKLLTYLNETDFSNGSNIRKTNYSYLAYSK